MSHLPFILAAYGLFVAAALILGLGATLRLRGATRRLRAVEPRGERAP